MKKIKYIPCFAGVALCLVMLFVCTSDCVLTVHDDILTYMQTRQGHLLKTAFEDAKHGRICHIPLTLLLFIPYLPDKVIFVRICSAAAVAFDLAGLYSFTVKNSGKAEAFLCCTLFSSFAFVSNQHNLLISYIIGHQIPIGLVLFSMSAFSDYLKNSREKTLITSASLLFLACMLYEASAAYILLLFIYSVYKSEGSMIKKTAQTISNLRFHILSIVIFVALYLIWRHFYPSDYSGAKLWFGNIPGSTAALFKYSFGMTPGLPLGAMAVKHYISFSDFIKNADLFILVSPLVASLMFYFLFPSVKKPEHPAGLFFFCLTGMLIPNSVICFTEKYSEWAGSSSYSYVTSFYSYFMMIPLILLVFKLICSKKTGKAALTVMSAAVFAVSLAASVNNEAWNIYYAENLRRYEAFRTAVSSEYFSSVPDGTTVYIPDYTGIHGSMQITKEFSMIYSDTDVTFQTDPDLIDFSGNVIMFRYDKDSGKISAGPVDMSLDFTSQSQILE